MNTAQQINAVRTAIWCVAASLCDSAEVGSPGPCDDCKRNAPFVILKFLEHLPPDKAWRPGELAHWISRVCEDA